MQVTQVRQAHALLKPEALDKPGKEFVAEALFGKVS